MIKCSLCKLSLQNNSPWITPWITVLLEKLTLVFLVKKFPATDPYPEPDISVHKFLSTPRSCEWFLLFRLSVQNVVCVPHLFHACYIPRPSHLPWFDRSNSTGEACSYEAPLYSVFSRLPIRLRSKCYPQHPVLKHLSLCSSLHVRDQASHPYKKKVEL